MDQISLPMRIALAASLVFAALWFVALRPKPVDPNSGPLPVTPAKTKKATPAKQTESTRVRKSESAKTSTPPTKRARPAAKKRAAAKPATGSAAVLADVRAGRTAVLLFWSMNSIDDRAVHSAVSKVDRRGGKVAVHFARMSNLPNYEAITKATPVTTSPTVLVIDRQSKARAIGGLTTTREIDAVVARALKVR